MRSTQGINSVYENIVKPGADLLFGGWRRAANAMTEEGATISDALYGLAGTTKNTGLSFRHGQHSANSARYENIMNGNLDINEGDEMRLHIGKIAGGIAGLGIGYRFLSGGGAYRDKDGNTDIAGIPFV